jgi:hypothetical protein
MDKRKFKVAINTSAQHIGKVVIGQDRMLALRTQSAQAGKEALRHYQKQKAKNINRKKDYIVQKGIERDAVKQLKANGDNPGSAHTIAKAMVKLAKQPRTVRAIKGSRKAKEPKKAR